MLSGFVGFHHFCANALTAVKVRTTPHLSDRCHTHGCSDSTESDTLCHTNSGQKLPHSQRQRKFTTKFDGMWQFLDVVSARNGKHSLSEGSRKSYLPVIRQYNQFLTDYRMTVGIESLKAYFAWLESLGQKASTMNHKRFALLKVIRAQFASDSVAKALAVEKAFELIPTYQTDKKITRDDVLTEYQVVELIEAAPTSKT